MNEVLLSIIIPTRNRQFYCEKVFEQIQAAVSENVEIVIQDNSDDDRLKTYFDGVLRKNTVYHYHEGIISFVDNFSEAVSLCHGKYVCMIGDDDGVLPIIELVVKYCDKNRLDAFVPGLNAVYSWPSATPFLKGAENGYLYITPITNKITKLNCSSTLKKLMRQCFQNYQETNVPRLYHGIVSRNKLQEIQDLTGHYFGGLTPDMYMSVALGYVCQRVEKSNFPITISGMCPQSGSAASATGAHTGELSDAPHFKGHSEYSWDNHIPYIYTVETIWAETALQAVAEMGQSSQIEEVNYAYLMAVLRKYPQFKNRMKEHMNQHKISETSVIYNRLAIIISGFAKRAYKAVTGYRQKSKRIYGVADIKEAEKIINDLQKGFEL